MKRVLVVDDSLFSRNTVIRNLGSRKYDITTAVNGRDALAKIDSFDPDLVITDLLMPVMDGIDFLRALHERGDKRPVCVVSADIQESSRNTCVELGARVFLNKPFKAEQLVEAVDAMLDDLKRA